MVSKVQSKECDKDDDDINMEECSSESPLQSPIKDNLKDLKSDSIKVNRVLNDVNESIRINNGSSQN